MGNQFKDHFFVFFLIPSNISHFETSNLVVSSRNVSTFLVIFTGIFFLKSFLKFAANKTLHVIQRKAH